MTSFPSPASMIEFLPDGLPELRVGRHRRPRDGACLMEYVSVLAGEPFSHRPVCTHPALAVLAHWVNDLSSDGGRPRLARLAPDLVTAHDDGRVANIGATVVLGVATAAITWAPHDRFVRRLHRRAVEQHAVGGERWRYGLPLVLSSLVGHMKGLDAESRDQCLYSLLDRVIGECRTGVVAAPGRPLIDRIDRRHRSLR